MDLSTIFKPARYCGEIHVSLADFARALARDEVNFSPAYQRALCWTLAQKEAFMGHLLTGGEVAPLIFQRVPDEGKAEILDGKQRATAILEWLRGEVGADIGPGARLFRCDVGKGLSRVDVRIRYIDLPWEARKAFYIKLNGAGTAHTAADLEAARLATE